MVDALGAISIGLLLYEPLIKPWLFHSILRNRQQPPIR